MSNLLEIKNLSYSRNLHSILENFNLEIPQGQIVGLLGANGAGKTTVMRLIAGSFLYRRGTISVQNSQTVAERKSKVSFTEQASHLEMNAPLYKVGDFYNEIYEDFNLTNFKQLLAELGLKIDQKLNQLSKGNYRKFVIAVTLARNVDLYLLDEPFDGIDSMSRKKIIASIISWKQDSATILVSDHHVADIANLLDSVVVIKNKKVIAKEAADTIREELGQDIETYYESYYGEENDD